MAGAGADLGWYMGIGFWALSEVQFAGGESREEGAVFGGRAVRNEQPNDDLGQAGAVERARQGAVAAGGQSGADHPDGEARGPGCERLVGAVHCCERVSSGGDAATGSGLRRGGGVVPGAKWARTTREALHCGHVSQWGSVADGGSVSGGGAP